MSRKWILWKKLLMRSGGALIVGITVSWTLYGIFGHRLIHSAYIGESFRIFSDVMEGRNSTPLSIYYQKADWLMLVSTIKILTLFLALVIVTIVLRYRLLPKVGLTISSP